MNKKAIIIGTGAGGLATAAYLAKSGVEVLALERAKQLGGFLNPFARKHYEFDPGVHYIGECNPGQAIHRLYNDLGLDADSMFCELDPEGFDEYRFPDFSIRMCRGLDRYRDRLAAAFPLDVAGVDRFMGIMRKFRTTAKLANAVPARGPKLRDLKAVPSVAALAPYLKATYKQLLDDTVSDPKLAAVLAAPCGDYGLPPSKASALYGLALIGHYADGGFFPRGGSRTMRDSLVDSARANGAEFRRQTPVQRIIVEGGRAVGVETEEGEVIRADYVISAIDPTLTYGKLLPSDAVPKRIAKKVANNQPSLASLCIFLGMKRDLRDHGLGAYNIWDYPSWDIESLYAPAFRDELPKDPFFFLSPNSLKDDTGSLAPDGCSTLEIVTFAPYSMFEEWDGQRALFRPQAYKDRKEELADWVLEAVERRHPGLVGDVAVREVGSPVSNNFYAGCVDGGIYGPAATPDQSLMFRYNSKSPVEGLYLAGSGVFGCGISPALMSGRMAAGLIRKHARNKPHPVTSAISDSLRKLRTAIG